MSAITLSANTNPVKAGRGTIINVIYNGPFDLDDKSVEITWQADDGTCKPDSGTYYGRRFATVWTAPNNIDEDTTCTIRLDTLVKKYSEHPEWPEAYPPHPVTDSAEISVTVLAPPKPPPPQEPPPQP